MAKVIEFYVPDKFRRRSKWIPPKQRGKVIQFPALQEVSVRCEVSRGWATTLTRSGGSKAMAKVIEFYVPDKFRRRSKWIPPKQRGKVIQFPALQKKSA